MTPDYPPPERRNSGAWLGAVLFVYTVIVACGIVGFLAIMIRNAI
jgi:hypothetical protein